MAKLQPASLTESDLNTIGIAVAGNWVVKLGLGGSEGHAAEGGGLVDRRPTISKDHFHEPTLHSDQVFTSRQVVTLST